MAINNQIIGGNFTDPSGAPLSNGTLVFELSQDEQSPTPGQIGASRKVTVTLDNTGNVPASPAVYIWANDSLNPVNSFYRVTAYTATGQPVWGPQNQQVLSSPSPFNLSNWVPNSVNLSSAIPAPTTLFQTNGTPNGSQTKLNLVGGSGMTITDDGSGDITFVSGSAASSLAISSAAAPATVNLTTQGTNDWLITNGQNFSGGQPAINGSTFFWKKKGNGFVINRSFVGYWSSLAPGGSAGSSGSGVAFTASAGDAVYSAGSGAVSPPPTNMTAYIQLSASPTAGGGYGYQFSVPSNSNSRTLKLYMTVQGILNPNQATVTAHMTDGSIADQSVTVTDAGTGGIGTAYVITITYKSASPCPLLVNVELSGANIGAVTFLGLTIA